MSVHLLGKREEGQETGLLRFMELFFSKSSEKKGCPGLVDKRKFSVCTALAYLGVL